ncbi:MAG: cyclohexa,5-dienecarbonyl-CoA hydratase [Thermodesulfobacteriota bacterium]|nr:cyclohexa,5-dienecarbonyl-CoA hydratase [Thermodesulfobacteriota bacterium]
MPEFKFIKFEIQEGVANITFDRPKHNVFNIEMLNELNSVLEGLTKNAEIKCVVFRAQGPSWCAGVDVGDHKPELVDKMISTFNRVFELTDRIEVPTIAAVQGACLGGGMEAAIACDIVIASKKAVFGQPEIKLGFFPPYAAIRLPQLVGPAKAIEICTTGKVYTADDAMMMGFVSRVVEDDKFPSEVDSYVKEICACSPLIIRINKKAVKRNIGIDFTRAVDNVSDLFLNNLMKTEDTLEGINSFYEKRKPAWKNR